MNMNQVTVPARDLAASVAFYRLLGLKQIVGGTAHYARFECPQGEATFSLHSTTAPGVDGGVVVYFETGDLDAQVRRLQQCGVVFTQEPRDESWRWREARLQDPSGNTICLYWAGANRKHPPWRMPD